MKAFSTYEEQIKILKERDLIFNDEPLFIEMLKKTGYYNLINGYSFIFKNQDNKFLNSASDYDIVALYKFDKNLRNIVYKYAMIFESKLKSSVSYTFSKYHGEDNRKYLVRNNFNKDVSKEARIAELINNCNKLIEEASDKNNKKYRNYIEHYVKEHGHVPLWVLIRSMTIGEVSMFYANMKLEEKTEIASDFNLKSSQLEIMIKIITAFRNAVAHDERLFCKKLSRYKLPYSLEIFDVMRIDRNPYGYPKHGISDFLCLLIVFKYLLEPLEFASFWQEFIIERDCLIKNIKSHFIARINDEMGLKSRWKNLQNYKVQN